MFWFQTRYLRYNEDPSTIAVCELVYKPEARVELKAGRSIRIVYKKARPVDLIFGVDSKPRKKSTEILIVELCFCKTNN